LFFIFFNPSAPRLKNKFVSLLFLSLRCAVLTYVARKAVFIFFPSGPRQPCWIGRLSTKEARGSDRPNPAAV
jgi:hypothetical protein